MKYLLVALSIGLLGCSVRLPPIQGGVYFTAETSAVVRWHPTDFPLTLVVDEQFDEMYFEALQQAVFAWNDKLDAQVFVISAHRVSRDSSEMDALDSGTVLVLQGDIPNEDSTLFRQGQAFLDYSQRTGRLRSARIVLDVAVSRADAMLVFKHELGHTLGLQHDGEIESIMYWHATASDGRIMLDDLNFVRWEMTND